jgi:hypothetical protein
MSPIRFNPSGTLDIGTDPADLPTQMQGKTAVSGAMTRCTNLSLDRAGIASTRRGSTQLNSSYDYSYSYGWEIDYITGSVINPFTVSGGTSYLFSWEADPATASDDSTTVNITPGALLAGINRILGQGGDRYSFAGGGIYLNESSIASDLTESNWEAIRYSAFNSAEQSIFALNGTDRKRITGASVQEWGSDSPTTAAIINAGDQTGLTGDYNAKYTWARKEDDVVVWESNPSPDADTAITLSDGSLVIQGDLPTDQQITHIRFYRTTTDGTAYYHDQDTALNWTEYDSSYLFDWETTYITGEIYQAFTESTAYGYTRVIYSWEETPTVESDDAGFKSTVPQEITIIVDSNTADTALGTEAVWTNHDRPPLGTVVLGPNFNGTVFILKENNLYYCLPNQPEYWPGTYYIEVSSLQYPCIAGAFLDGVLYVATGTEIYQISGSGAGSFFPLPMSAQTGTVNYRAFEAIKGHGIYHIGADGVYLYSGGKDSLVSRGNLDAVFNGTGAGNIPGLNRTYLSNCWLKAFHGKLYIGYPGGDSEYPDNIFVIDLQTQRLTHFSYSATFRAVGRDFTNNRLLAGDTDGFSWVWEDMDSTDDAGTAIAWQIQSADFNQLRKYFPRYAKYDVKVGTGATANGYILLDDVNKQTHPLNGDRLTRKRLVAGCTGDRISVRVMGTGTVDIYGIEVE